ncbi:3-oxoacyl-ACP reductase FabG [Rhizobium sp. Root482]|uniref:3-oxoacyl-ACP reductase FabG n=1 Tax=Rhizobium sp. Root482 TaxID=1736543 RepID=UPI0007014FA7|nr:3-ketoacyl-ACP reductase [Rhizobium sp. Root482]
MLDASQRIAVVTGGSSGIGLAAVNHLLHAGFRVAFFGQNAGHVEEAAARLGREFDASRVLARCVDLESPPQIADFFVEVQDHWRVPDTLICSAGISPKGPDGAIPFAGVTLEEWNRVLSVNLTGTMLCCQAVVPAMAAQRFGRVILIGSIAGRALPKVAGTAYVVSKAALSGLSRSLVATCAGTGVTVNIVAPGRIVTQMAGAPDSAINRAALTRIPVGRLGDPTDIASTIGFLASSDAGFINGAIIDVNGGEFAPH